MNILILSAGTHCQLMKYFMQAENGFDKVVATDCSVYAPAIFMANKHYIVPRMREKGYLPILEKICKAEEINAILPLSEDELELISENKEMFVSMGVLVISSALDAIKTCRDKYLLYQRLSQVGIQCVETYDYNTEWKKIKKLSLPILAKERYGAGSIGNLKINHWPLLHEFEKNSDKKIIVQPYMDVEEYGVDAYVDFVSGEIVSIFAKEKLRMRAGETEKSKSVKDDKLFDLVNKAIVEMKFKGPIDMDIFKYDGEYHILEINPRFGGGYPHAYECGVNFIKYICINAHGKNVVPEIGYYEENQVLLKYTEAMLKPETELKNSQKSFVLNLEDIDSYRLNNQQEPFKLSFMENFFGGGNC